MKVLLMAMALSALPALAAAADCKVKPRDAAIAYVDERAPEAEMVRLVGLKADRFRALLMSTGPYVDGERVNVQTKADEVRVYWMRPLSHILILTDECALFAATMKDHVAQWALHRTSPDQWPMPPEYQNDGF